MSKNAYMWEKLGLIEEWFDSLNDLDDEDEPLERIFMVEEWCDFVLKHGVDKIPTSALWKKALMLSEKYGYPFCRDFLPEPDDRTCKKFGMTYEELTGKTVCFKNWRIV